MLFAEVVNVFEGLSKWRRHDFVQVVVVFLRVSNPRLYEVISARLFLIICEPRQVKLVHAEADEVEQ